MHRYLLLSVLCWGSVLNGVFASIFTVNISGSVMLPADCKINNGLPLDIKFGEMRIDKIDGNAYQQPITFTLECSNLPSNALKLQWQGAAAAFDSGALKTSAPGLGIAFLNVSGKRLNINSQWITFNYPAVPVLTAVPIRDKNSVLSGGSFSASAALVVEIQ